MKQRVLVLVIKRMVWVELVLMVVLVLLVFVQSQLVLGVILIVDVVVNGVLMIVVQVDGVVCVVVVMGVLVFGVVVEVMFVVFGVNGQGKVMQIKWFEVMGLLIWQVDKVGFNQVQIVMSKDIENSGQISVVDYLCSILVNLVSSWSEGLMNSFVLGGVGIVLCGFSEKYMLVLIDGMWVLLYVFVVNGSDQFFDLNMLLFNIIDCIEIVKIGVVFQYGFDVIVGVVNIIMKKNFQGFELGGSYGGVMNGEGGQGMMKFSILGGFGDLNVDCFNVIVVFSYYKLNGILIVDCDMMQNQNFFNFLGGLLNQSVLYWCNLVIGVKVLLSLCLNGGQVVLGILVVQVNGFGMVCVNNIVYVLLLLLWIECLSVKVYVDFKIIDVMQVFVDFWESNNMMVMNNFVGCFGNSMQIYDLVMGGFILILNLVLGSNLYNLFGVLVKLVYVFLVMQVVYMSFNFWCVVMGVKGLFSMLCVGDWDWIVFYMYLQNMVLNNYLNLINVVVLENIVQNGVFNFVDLLLILNGLNGLYGSMLIQVIMKFDVVDVMLFMLNLFMLFMGNVGLGFGM